MRTVGEVFRLMVLIKVVKFPRSPAVWEII